MKKLYRWFRRLPRSVKAVLNLVLLVVVLLLFYISIDSPSFTPEQQFRKEEKAYLVGPAKILGTVPLKKPYGPCDRLIIAASDEGVTLFQYDKSDLETNKLVYRKKQGDVTVLSVPTMCSTDSFRSFSYLEIPVIVFDGFPNAVRAEMQIILNNGNNKHELTAKRDAEGYFLFTLTAGRFSGMGREGEGFSDLTERSDDYTTSSLPWKSIPVTVRFYDESDNMIAERYVEICSSAGEAHAQKQGNT